MFQAEGDRAQWRQFTRRALLLGLGQTAAFGLLGARLHQLQVTEEQKYRALAERNRMTTQWTAPVRGRIFDRSGALIADNIEEFRATIVPDLAGDLEAVLVAYAKVVPLPPAERDRVLVTARRQGRSLPVVLSTELSWEQFAQINVLAPHLPGVRTEIATSRRYHHGADLAHILGYVGAPAKSDLATDPALRLPGARVGQVGVERGAEARLRGQAGEITLAVDARGRIVSTMNERLPERGEDVALTVDWQLQAQVRARLGRERRASVVVLNADTGEIAVMASHPSYDPNQIAQGISQAEWSALIDAPDDPMTNRAIRGQYPPGSTFKMVTALAALQAGVIEPRTRFYCGGSFDYADQRFHCWNRRGHQNVSLQSAITYSCDVYFYEIARRIGIERIAAMARLLGLGETYACGLPLQKAGLIPDADWKRLALNQAWFGGETILASIGQGYVLSTPLQLAVMTARIASGRRVEPTIVRRADSEPEVEAPALGLDEAWLAEIRKAMVAVVHGGGTGGSAALRSAGVRLAGKTGTSQVKRISTEEREQGIIRNADREYELRDHSLFVGYTADAPAGTPRYAAAAVVEHGGGGSEAAGPLVRDVLDLVLGFQPMKDPGFFVKARRMAGPVLLAPEGVAGQGPTDPSRS